MKIFQILLVLILAFNLNSCNKIKNLVSFDKKNTPEAVINKFFENLFSYDDSQTGSDNKIDEIINKYLDVDKLQENSIRMAAEYSRKVDKKDFSDAEIENVVKKYKSIGKDFKETAIKFGLQANAKAFQNKLGPNRKFKVDIKNVEYIDGAAANKAKVSYAVRADDNNNEFFVTETAILEKINNQWKIVAYTLSDDVIESLKNQQQQLQQNQQKYNTNFTDKRIDSNSSNKK